MSATQKWFAVCREALNKRDRECSDKSGMHNIRPAEAFNPARKTPNFVYFTSFFDKTPFKYVKTYQIWHLDLSKKIWPAMRFELCIPGQEHRFSTQTTPRPIFIQET